MPTVADVVRHHGADYLRRFGHAMPAMHRKVLHAVAACRSGELGHIVFACSDCGRELSMGRSCGNRHCPACQKDKAKAWLDKQIGRLLPCPHFLLTFTLPAELRSFVRSHQRIGYDALFHASSEALKTLAADSRFVGTPRPGFFGVLHTWGRTLDYHPHVHYVVPGGGPDRDASRWLPSRADFFVPVRALSKIFRAKFRDAIRKAGLLQAVDPAAWRKDWVVHSQPVDDGRTSLHYLAPYVFRVAISDHRIRHFDHRHVTFSFRKSGARRWRTMTVDAHEFLRRFLHHVLPTGFQKVRYYGFASPNSKHSLEAVRWIATLHAGERFFLQPLAKTTAPAPALRCANCGGQIHLVSFLPRRGRACFDTS